MSASIAGEAMNSIRMVVACGAEARIAAKYAQFVDASKKHAQFSGPVMALQFGFIVCHRSISFLALGRTSC